MKLAPIARGLALSLAIGASAPALAEKAPAGDELDRMTEELLTDEQRAAIERFLAMARPVIERFMSAIDSMPRYEAPVILPNGDILIRRKRDGETGENPDGSLDL